MYIYKYRYWHPINLGENVFNNKVREACGKYINETDAQRSIT